MLTDWKDNAHSHLWHLSSTKYSLSQGSCAKALARLIFWPDDGAGWKVRCLLGTQRCVPDFMAVSPKVEIFHSFSKNIHPTVGTLHLVPPAGWVHHLGTVNIYTSIWASPFSWCWDVKRQKVWPAICLQWIALVIKIHPLRTMKTHTKCHYTVHHYDICQVLYRLWYPWGHVHNDT